jgi:hypothetical protein
MRHDVYDIVPDDPGTCGTLPAARWSGAGARGPGPLTPIRSRPSRSRRTDRRAGRAPGQPAQ